MKKYTTKKEEARREGEAQKKQGGEGEWAGGMHGIDPFRCTWLYRHLWFALMRTKGDNKREEGGI